jgi:hypothetical protein
VSQAEVPPALQNLLTIVVGYAWPDGDTGVLRSDANAWRRAAAELTEITGSSDNLASYALSGIQGATATAFATRYQSLFHGDPAFGTVMAHICQELAAALDALAQQIEFTRILIIELLVTLLIQLMFDAVIAFLSGGIISGLTAARIAATRAACLVVVRKAILELVRYQISQTLLQLVLTLTAQGLQIAKGTRNSVNSREIANSGINGLTGGTAGALAGGAGRGAVQLSGTALSWELSGTPLAEISAHIVRPNMNSAGRAVRQITQFTGEIGLNAGTGVVEATAQDSALTGRVNEDDQGAGALNGVGNGTTRRIGAVLNPGSTGPGALIQCLHPRS